MLITKDLACYITSQGNGTLMLERKVKQERFFIYCYNLYKTPITGYIVDLRTSCWYAVGGLKVRQH